MSQDDASHRLQCTVHCTGCAMHNVQCILCSSYCGVYTIIQSTASSEHCSVSSILCTLYTVQGRMEYCTNGLKFSPVNWTLTSVTSGGMSAVPQLMSKVVAVLQSWYYHSAQCTLHSANCTVHSVQCTVYSAHCTVQSVQCTLYCANCTVHTVQFTVYCAPCKVHSNIVQCTEAKVLVKC